LLGPTKSIPKVYAESGFGLLAVVDEVVGGLEVGFWLELHAVKSRIVDNQKRPNLGKNEQNILFTQPF
jgi:hypothetical protein